MKKIISILVVTVMLAAAFAVPSFAEDSVNVTVTISDGNGNNVVALEPLAVTDTDDDGKLTVNDALALAHDKWYEGGAAAGYESFQSQWGLSLGKLWGVENGGSYGFYVNHAMAMSLEDELKDGDYLAAFVYVDAQGLSDTYGYISQTEETDPSSLEAGTYHYKAMYSGWDENWNPVVLPIVGAAVEVDGYDTHVITDENGEFTVDWAEAGDHVLTVVSGEKNYACAVFKVTVAVVTETEATTTEESTESATEKAVEDTAAVPESAEKTTFAPETAKVSGTKTAAQTGDMAIAVIAVMTVCAASAAVILRKRED